MRNLWTEKEGRLGSIDHWVVLSMITLAFMSAFVLNNMGGMIELDENLDNEGLVLSFVILFLMSEAIGFILARLVIDRIPWAYHIHAFFCKPSFP